MNKKVLSCEALHFNLDYFNSFAPQICAVVKADAYGHGLEEVVKILGNRPDYYGVANESEARRVESVNKDAKVLILGKVSDFSLAKHYFLTAVSLSDVKKAIRLKVTERCFIKLSTGMNRFGIDCENENLLKTLKKLIKNHEFAGFSTHFSSTDKEKITKKEYELYLKAKNFLGKNFKSCFGGSGAKHLPGDILRVGLGLYGYGDKNLKKVMVLKSRVLQIRSLEKGERAGYEGAFKAKRRTTLAIVGVGYGDGFDRNSSRKLRVKIEGKEFKVVGTLCMDACFVDVTGGNVKVGSEVLMFDDAKAMAKWTHKIEYEVLTSFSQFRGEIIKS